MAGDSGSGKYADYNRRVAAGITQANRRGSKTPPYNPNANSGL